MVGRARHARTGALPRAGTSKSGLAGESGDHAFSVVLGAARVPAVSAKGADGGTLTAPHPVEQPPTAQIQLSNNRHLQTAMRSSR